MNTQETLNKMLSELLICGFNDEYILLASGLLDFHHFHICKTRPFLNTKYFLEVKLYSINDSPRTKTIFISDEHFDTVGEAIEYAQTVCNELIKKQKKSELAA